MRLAIDRGELAGAQKFAAYLEVYESLVKDLSKDGPDAERANPASVEVVFRHPHSRRRNVATAETDDQ